MDESDQSTSVQGEPDDRPPASIEVEILDGLSLLDSPTRQALRVNAMRALGGLPGRGQIRVRIVDDQRMIEAHAKFSGLSTTTDVLTFDLSPGAQSFEEKILDTDLTVCFDQAERQASARNHPVERELLLYIIHGTLHCLGYDDHDEEGYQRMHQMEDELLTRIGFGATFFSEEQGS